VIGDRRHSLSQQRGKREGGAGDPTFLKDPRRPRVGKTGQRRGDEETGRAKDKARIVNPLVFTQSPFFGPHKGGELKAPSSADQKRRENRRINLSS